MKNKYVVWGLLLVSIGIAQAAPPPIAVFARLEQFKSPTISPDGRYLAYITQVNGRRHAAVVDLKTKGATPKGVLPPDKDNKFDMQWCGWANDTRLLCGYQAPSKWYGQTIRTSRLIAVNADGSAVKMLQQNAGSAFTLDQDNVLDMTPDDPDTVLVTSHRNNSKADGFIPEEFPSVFELNIYTGALRERVLPFRPIYSFYSDGHGNIRLGVGRVDTTVQYFARLEGEREWRKLAKIEVFETTDKFEPIAIIPGTNKAYAVGPSNGRDALWQIDLEDKEKPQLIFDQPQVDVAAAFRTSRGELIGVMYETDRPFIYYTNPRFEPFMRGINSALPGSFNLIVDATRDWATMIIRARSDTDAGTYYLYDAQTKKLQPIGRAYPELNPEQLPRMRSIEYPAADGTMIPGYITTPIGVRAEKLPLIVMPHGGPIARDTWRFDFLRHFLASRGYAVLQMNFRGSSGYGDKWFREAFQDWGGLTYSDITDAARWAVAQGIADPQRMCIVGWSFGGYAALMGATRNPDIYKCAISIAGVSDLLDLEKGKSQGGRDELRDRQIGTDKDKLKASSPRQHAADVKMPVLMIHGTMDVQAPYSQSERMADALQKAGKKNYKLVAIEDADHGLVRESERVTLLTETEQFLQKHLGLGAIAADH